jgi:hypothetical protein
MDLTIDMGSPKLNMPLDKTIRGLPKKLRITERGIYPIVLADIAARDSALNQLAHPAVDLGSNA